MRSALLVIFSVLLSVWICLLFYFIPTSSTCAVCILSGAIAIPTAGISYSVTRGIHPPAAALPLRQLYAHETLFGVLPGVAGNYVPDIIVNQDHHSTWHMLTEQSSSHPVGLLRARTIALPLSRTGLYCDSLCVLPSARGRGYSRMLISHAIASEMVKITDETRAAAGPAAGASAGASADIALFCINARGPRGAARFALRFSNKILRTVHWMVVPMETCSLGGGVTAAVAAQKEHDPAAAALPAQMEIAVGKERARMLAVLLQCASNRWTVALHCITESRKRTGTELISEIICAVVSAFTLFPPPTGTGSVCLLFTQWCFNSNSLSSGIFSQEFVCGCTLRQNASISMTELRRHAELLPFT